MISSALLRDLVDADAASPDAEICGLLIGRDAIEEIVPTRNVARNPEKSFEIDPSALFAAIRRERDEGKAILGYYHSHPHGAAVPSAHDAAQACVDNRIWLIVGRDAVRTWHLVEPNLFEEVELHIVD